QPSLLRWQPRRPAISDAEIRRFRDLCADANQRRPKLVRRAEEESADGQVILPRSETYPQQNHPRWTSLLRLPLSDGVGFTERAHTKHPSSRIGDYSPNNKLTQDFSQQ